MIQFQFFFGILLIHYVEIRGKLLKSRFTKNDSGKPEKTLFLAFFDILVKITPGGRFQPKNAKNLVS